jgi:hypothetical protein
VQVNYTILLSDGMPVGGPKMQKTRWCVTLATVLLISNGIQAGVMLDRMAVKSSIEGVYPQPMRWHRPRRDGCRFPCREAIVVPGVHGSNRAKLMQQRAGGTPHQRFAHRGSMSDAILVGVFDGQVPILNPGSTD